MGIIKIISIDIAGYCRKAFRFSAVIRKNPTCRLSRDSTITTSKLGKYVAVFGNSIIQDTKVGDYSYIQTNSRIFNCSIGKFCSIAPGVSIAPGMHEITRVSTHPALVQRSTPLPMVFARKDNIVTCKQVEIRHDVWIGENVIIIDGVTIGNGAVIAAGAVVVKDVEPYSVVGGVPARHIKYRFDEKTVVALQKSQWWDYPEEWFEKNAESMLDIVNSWKK